MDIHTLPFINACLNGTATVFLVAGGISIHKKQVTLHRNCMVISFVVSAFFLISYLYYHFHFPTKTFPELGLIKVFYLGILFPHICLATIMVPMIFRTFFLAFTEQVEKHKWWARLTYPIWLFVSVTGVIIYLMLYEWFAV